MITELSEYTIERDRWVFGGARLESIFGPTYLLNHLGNKCCLGHVCEQHLAHKFKEEYKSEYVAEKVHRIPDTMDGKKTPYNLRIVEGMGSIPGFLDSVDSNSYLGTRMMEVNDSTGLTPAKIEARLIELAAEADITLKFVGEYPDEIKAFFQLGS